MSPQDDERFGPAADSDHVAGFFSAARAHVRDEPVTDLDWQRIVHDARRASRRRSRMGLLSSAAVAVIAIVAVLVWQQQGVTGGVQRGEAISGSNSVVRTGAATEPPTVSAAQSPTAVPGSFQTWSVSNAGQSTLYALGSQTCGTDVCPVLLRSGTNGQAWAAVHKFSGTDVSAATSNNVPQIQPQRALTQTRFASPSVGFVFGGDLWVTRDSGATFTQVAHPGTTVLDVEINQKQAVLLSADNCGQGECYGPVYVTRFDPATDTITKADAQVTPSVPISGGTVLVQNGQAFVQLTSAGSGTALAPMRLDGSTLHQVTSPAACNGTSLQAVTAATNTSALQLFALCDPQQRAGGQLAYTIVRSDDGGNTWRSVSVGALILPRLGQVWLAVADANHMVASAGGPRDTAGVPASSAAGSLEVSTNGRGFGPVSAPKGSTIPSTGFDWTASAGGAYFYAVPRNTPGFWMTTRFGGPWTVIDPRH